MNCAVGPRTIGFASKALINTERRAADARALSKEQHGRAFGNVSAENLRVYHGLAVQCRRRSPTPQNLLNDCIEIRHPEGQDLVG